MNIVLRPHQQLAYEEILDIESVRPVLVADTGWGKTQLALQLTRTWLSQGRKVTFLVHRTSLVANASQRCDQYNIPHFVLDSNTPKGAIPDQDFRIVSLQTLESRNEFYDWMLDDVLILDECHQTTYFSYIKRNWDKPKFILGMTATPWRLKKTESLADFYDYLVKTMLPSELIEKGWRVPFVYFSNPKIKLDTLERGGSESGFKRKSVSITVDTPEAIEAAIKNWLRLGQGRRTLAFCCDVNHAKNLTEAFLARDIRSGYIEAATPPEERERLIAKLEALEINVLCSCDTLKAGVDIPSVEAILDLSPSLSRAAVYQGWGRGCRLSPETGKTDCLILDMVGNVRHGMVQDYTWEDYLLRPAKEKGTGEAPIRVCPECDFVCHPTKTHCPHCGFEFPKPERQIATGELMLRYGDYHPSHWKAPADKHVQFYQDLKRKAFLSRSSPAQAIVKFKQVNDFHPPVKKNPEWDLGAVFRGECTSFLQEEFYLYLKTIASRPSKPKPESWIEAEFIKEFGTAVGVEFFGRPRNSTLWNDVIKALKEMGGNVALIKSTLDLISFDGSTALLGIRLPVMEQIVKRRTPDALKEGFQRTLGYPVNIQFSVPNKSA